MPTPNEAVFMAVLVERVDADSPEDSEAQVLGVATPLPVPALTVTEEEALGKEEVMAEAEGITDGVVVEVSDTTPLADAEGLPLASIEAV